MLPSPADNSTPIPVAAAGVTQEAPVVSAGLESAQRLLALINDERRKAGVGNLSINAALATSAQAHAQAIAAAGVGSHQLPGGPSLQARAESAGYVDWSALAENVAWGLATPEEVVALWLAEPAHRDNLLSPAYTDAGVGHSVSSETGHFWVLDLGSR